MQTTKLIDRGFGLEYRADYSGSGATEVFACLENAIEINSQNTANWPELDQVTAALLGLTFKQARIYWQKRLELAELLVSFE